MSLPDQRVFPLLQDQFVLGWKNIKRETFVGDSSGYSARHSCVGTTNGAGSRNLQLFILSDDLVVMHAITGFWHPADLAHQLRFGQVAWRLYQDASRSMAQKCRMYRLLLTSDLRSQSPEMYARSDWQRFDARREGAEIAQDVVRDTFEQDSHGQIKRTITGAAVLKPLNVLMHERMAARPFVALEDFDTEAFVDNGRRLYDNNRGISRSGKKL